MSPGRLSQAKERANARRQKVRSVATRRDKHQGFAQQNHVRPATRTGILHRRKFPLDWMYSPSLPNGLIMKINRQHLPSSPTSSCGRDHEYWSRYLQPMLGDWLTYDTSVASSPPSSRKVYLSMHWASFTGDPQFRPRRVGSKSLFSKLRSSIGGLYAGVCLIHPE